MHSAHVLSPCCRCGLALVDVEIPLVALADGVHSRSFSGEGGMEMLR